MLEYVVQTAGWYTDAHGTTKMYGAGELIVMNPAQAHWLLLSGQLAGGSEVPDGDSGEPNLDAMTVAQLQGYADSIGLDLSSGVEPVHSDVLSVRRADMIKAIQAELAE